MAGLLLARGQDARPALAPAAGHLHPGLDPRKVADAIFESTLVAAGIPGDGWLALWPGAEPRLDTLLGALEGQAQAQGLARMVRTDLERRILDAASDRWPVTVGRTHALALEVTEPIPDLHLRATVERLRCLVRVDGEALGTLELPVCDGLVPGWVLSDAIAADFAWILIGKFLQRRDGVAPAPRSGQWPTLLQELWGRPDWPEERFYREPPVPPTPAREGGTVDRPPRSVARNWMIVEASDSLSDLVSDAATLDVELTVGGVSVGVIALAVRNGSMSADRLVVELTAGAGFELGRIAVREGIIGMPLAGFGTLRARLAQKAAARREARPSTLAPPANARLASTWQRAATRAVAPDRRTVVLGRHAPGPPGTSASRCAVLPSAAAEDLARAAAVAGEPRLPAARLWARRPQQIAYAPDLFWKAPPIENGRGAVDPDGTPGSLSDRLSILLYHRVSRAGAAATSRYRVDPEAFDEQVRYLANAGYRSVTLEQLRVAHVTRSPLPARSVIITFDDGYRDFLADAWPTLRRYGYSAIVFLVADRIGGTNAWDAAYGETVPLLNWEEIRRLQIEGVEFGSHTATHPRLPGLAPTDIVREAARSRAILQRGLARAVSALAYPHGVEDGVVRHLIGACGYLYGLLAWGGPSRIDDSLLALPRIEITGGDTIESFRSKVTPMEEGHEPAPIQ